jgi:S1-C subfamily serine protease
MIIVTMKTVGNRVTFDFKLLNYNPPNSTASSCILGYMISVRDSAAKKAGLKAGNRSVIVDGEKINVGGDVIVGVDGVTVRRLEDILVHIECNRRPHDFVTLNIIRDGEAMSIAVELGERPPPS